VKDVATDEARKVADSVKDEVRQHTPELKNAARDVAESVKEDVKQSAGRVKDEAKAAATGSQPGINPS
jgi:gas vesicle protein